MAKASAAAISPKAPESSVVPWPLRATVHMRAASTLEQLEDESIPLIVTSPPYPMIKMWDEGFAAQGCTTYEQMHHHLDLTWQGCARVLQQGGIAAIVIGDALRKVEGRFQLFPNHARILQSMTALGLTPLPFILWKKPTNRPNAFLGSGFLPPNAYVTLDCEYILLFRKGDLRSFPPKDPARVASTFTKEQRDVWFSQIWEGLRGARQDSPHLARRTAAFPPEVPRRLIAMFSVLGDTVLDPFAGTGTTLVQALQLGRSTIGYELDGRLDQTLRSALHDAAAAWSPHDISVELV